MKVGKATVTVTGKGNYVGSVTGTFVINPKGTSVTKLIKAKKSFTVKYKKQTEECDGYEVQYSTSSGFKKGNKKAVIKKAGTISKKIKKLKAKKKYYVRVRTYRVVGGVKYYSAWSKKKSVKTR